LRQDLIYPTTKFPLRSFLPLSALLISSSQTQAGKRLWRSFICITPLIISVHILSYSNQRDDDEREVNELKARQKKRNDDIWKRKQEEVKQNPDERGNISRTQKEGWAGIDRGPGNSKRIPAIKIEGAVTTKSTFEKKDNKTTITKPRNRGAVVGNGETLNLEDDHAKKVSMWWLDLGIEQVCI
jgi:hypothetical protein